MAPRDYEEVSPAAGGPAAAISRSRYFDLLRLLFAVLVLLTHAAEIADGNASRELLNRVTHSGVTLGVVGVDGFFLLSAYLILQSWMHDPELLNFTRKRLLRIVPGVVVAWVVSSLVVGWLAPAVPHYFQQLMASIRVGQPARPPVLPGMPIPAINGSLWTIPFELRCYLLVALLGVCGIVRRPVLWLAITVPMLALIPQGAFQAHFAWHHLVWVTGAPDQFLRFVGVYLVGGCFYLFRGRIPYRPVLAWAAGLALGSLLFVAPVAELAVAVMGGYLLFYFAQRPLWIDRKLGPFPDISYGVYLYGWPVESLLTYFFHGSPWIIFAEAVPICFALGWLSWHFVERPMLQLKRRATAKLPPA